MPTDAPEFKTLTGPAATNGPWPAPGNRWGPPLLPNPAAADRLRHRHGRALLPGGCLQWCRAGTAPQARFTDITAESGLTFRRIAGATSNSQPPTTLGGAGRGL